MIRPIAEMGLPPAPGSINQTTKTFTEDGAKVISLKIEDKADIVPFASFCFLQLKKNIKLKLSSCVNLTG